MHEFSAVLALDTASHLVSADADKTTIDSVDVSIEQYCKRIPRLHAHIFCPGLNYTLVNQIVTSHSSPTRSEHPDTVSAPPRKGSMRG